MIVMTGYQALKRRLLPFVKGLPIILGLTLVSYFLARKSLSYSPNEYQSIAKIKLDDQKFGFSANNLYGDFDVFATENKIEAEAEVLKSPLLIAKVADSLALNVQIFRKGKLKNTLLHTDRIFDVNVISFPGEEDLKLVIQVNAKDRFDILDEEENLLMKGVKFSQQFEIFGCKLKFDPIVSEINSGKSLKGTYLVKVLTPQSVVSHITSTLDVKAMDKDLPILRIVYREEDPRLAKKVIDELCEIYIQDYINTKTAAANKTVAFIDNKLQKVGRQLSQSELELEGFKKANGVVNTLQETETGLREISKLKIQLINLEMSEKSILELREYIKQGEYFDETAIAFGFGDLLMTELVKKLKLWQDERRDLLLKFKNDHPKIISVDGKIEDVKRYILEAIEQNLKEIRTKTNEIREVMVVENAMFDELPTREKNHKILEREFNLLQDVYNFLSQKKIEATIAASANIAFHRVIQPAVISKEPVSPNRTLIKFVSILLGFLTGVILVYARKSFSAKVVSKNDLERASNAPVLSVIRKHATEYDFDTLARKILLNSSIGDKIITVNSTLKEEGKGYVSKGLSKALIRLGYNVSTLQFDFGKKEVRSLCVDNRLSKEKILETYSESDFVLIETPPTSQQIDAVEVMGLGDMNIYLAKANATNLDFIEHLDLLIEKYELTNVQWILNNAHRSFNHSGEFVGSRFNRSLNIRSIPQRLIYIYDYYMKK